MPAERPVGYCASDDSTSCSDFGECVSVIRNGTHTLACSCSFARFQYNGDSWRDDPYPDCSGTVMTAMPGTIDLHIPMTFRRGWLI
jgi:hypothetical protein